MMVNIDYHTTKTFMVWDWMNDNCIQVTIPSYGYLQVMVNDDSIVITVG